MARTKKVGYTGKYSSRYGRKIRERLIKVGVQKKYRCPECLKLTVRREAAGIWSCSSCGLKFAGKAFRPE